MASNTPNEDPQQQAIPDLSTRLWARHAYAFLHRPPEIPSGLDTRFAMNTRMYSLIESEAWVASNLLWLEEALQLLSDSRLALAVAQRHYADGFPAPPSDIASPNMIRFGGPPPIPDPALTRRARFFRFYIDDAATRVSASFNKSAGLLASYYELEFSTWEKLFSDLENASTNQPALSWLRSIIASDAYKRGQRYRDPRIHGLGTSFRALYGGTPELLASVDMWPGIVGMRPRETVTAQRLLSISRSFYRKGVEFARAGVRLIESSPRTFTALQPFIARRIQQPSMHASVDSRKMPTDRVI